jgi:hypothetical protein
MNEEEFGNSVADRIADRHQHKVLGINYLRGGTSLANRTSSWQCYIARVAVHVLRTTHERIVLG